MARRGGSPITPLAGERVLAWADSDDGALAGTRDALYLEEQDPAGTTSVVRVPWHEVDTADWQVESSTLVVRGVGRYGEPQPEHRRVLEQPGRLLELLRERVSASIVLTRRVGVDGPLAFTVIGRRASSGERTVAWFVDYDPALDPDDPLVEMAVQEALAEARAEVGQG
jgi:hypothetical protein